MKEFSARSLWTNAAKMMALAVIISFTTPAAQAQFSDSYNFLKAVEDREGDVATRLIEEPGSGAVIINTRDVTTGRTALHIVVERRDTTWLGFLLAKGANPNVADKKNVTPLMLATQLGFLEGTETLLKYKANIDQANRSGETALILAVHLRNPEMVRLLLKKGANPDKTDTIAGLSARDYAARDGRNNGILTIMETEAKPKGAKQPELDFSGIGEVK
jgi:uncharacterized protein